jgi:peptidoglycan DL-endopeptidase CwlO
MIKSLALAAVLGAALLVTLCGGEAAATPPPSVALQGKEDRARAVEADVHALDVQLGKVVDDWDGAQVQLAATKRQLAANKVDLAQAQRRHLLADRRVARRLVALYESEQPDVVQLLVDARSLSEVIDVAQYSHDVAASDRRIADEARRSRDRLATASISLHETEHERRLTVDRLNRKRAQIGAMLGKRRTLLASIQSEVATLKARELAEQRRLAAEAAARLARRQAELRAAAEARARDAVAASKAAEAPRPAPTPSTTVAGRPTVASAPATTGAVTTTATPATTTSAAPVAPPAPSPGGGHPAAATAALAYLGVPYQWGGASPSTGFDCSGLTMYVFAQLGVQLPHYAAAQYGYGSPVPRDQLQPGDLVFFDGLSHVGIYIGNGQMVHAPETGDVVKITPLSDFGTSYVGARRV